MADAENNSPAQPLGLSLDLTYVAHQDRIRLTMRQAGIAPVDWWWTRRMTLRVLQVWVNKLDAVPLPDLPSLPWLSAPGKRDLAQEHALSLEFDGPQGQKQPLIETEKTYLLTTVHLNVGATDCSLQMVAGQASVRLSFTRREAHAMLEAIALQARQAHWLDSVSLPAWLGVSGQAPPAGDP